MIQIKPLEFIQHIHAVRSLDEGYLTRLTEKIKALGVKPAYPLSVTPDGVLFGGCHRFEVFKRLGHTEAWMHIHQPDSLDREAIDLNRASEDAKPLTFVDYAELIWRKLAEPGATQQKIADDLRWSRAQVSQYAMLNKLCSDAWSVVATSFKETVADDDDSEVAGNATTVAKTSFSERLLRDILDLQPDQQVDLCKRLVKGKDSKGHKFGKADFKAEAEGYRALNALVGLAQSQLTAIIPGSLDQDPLLAYWTPIQQALSANKEYVAEYLKAKAPGEKFAKLIQAAVDDWQQKSNVQVIVKDIRLLTALDIADDSVDCIITDPPYPKEYVDLFDDLGALAARVLKPGGSLVVMTGQLYLPRYLELLAKHLNYHWLLAYTTPGGQAVQIWNQEVNTFWKPLLWFVKDQRDARWVSDVINTPVNANDKQHHHWGQSVSGMTAIVEKFSNPGDLVLDPFLGGGTTGVVCKATGRRFVGVELDDVVAAQSLARIHGGA